MSEFDFERADGLPGPLPKGEQMLWQGRPDWRSLAVQAFHIRKVAAYFAVIAVAQAAFRLHDGATFAQGAASALILAGAGVGVCAILGVLAYISARTAMYTLTTKRIVMKVGMALSVSINIPFKQIDGASLGATGGGFGNLCFRVRPENRVAYLLLWPHAKPWAFAKPEPAFRAIADADAVADLAAKALGSATAVEVPQAETRAAAMLAAAE
jgi:Bacterial PH domain